ncbi:MAG: hypothetical protein ACLFQ8_00660 [Candidatus Aenigmatarchaeota archaeon]
MNKIYPDMGNSTYNEDPLNVDPFMGCFFYKEEDNPTDRRPGSNYSDGELGEPFVDKAKQELAYGSGLSLNDSEDIVREVARKANSRK